MNVDIGGSKAKRDMDGKWRICDISPGCEFPCNLNTDKLPFENNSINAIFCSHTLEHIEPSRIPVVLKQMKRVLIPGHKIRIIVPDAEKAIKWYLKNPGMLQRSGAPTKPKFVPNTRMGYLNAWFYTHGKGHRSGFDMELLNVYLKNAGFVGIRRRKYNECSKIFKGKDYARYEWNSIFCEASKPKK